MGAHRRVHARSGKAKHMGNRDKGGRNTKSAAAKTPKEKREAKRDKKQAKARDARSE